MIVADFRVEKNGSLSNVNIIDFYNRDSVIHDDILRVIKKMPKWKPGTIRNTAVRSNFKLPVLFKLDE